MVNEQDIQKKVIEFNVLDTRLQELEQGLALLKKQIAELESCKLSLDEVKKIKKDTSILSPLSSGVFVKSKLEDNKEVIIDLGSRVMCTKSNEEAKKIIQEKLDQVVNVHNNVSNEINALVQNIIKLEKEIVKEQAK